MRTEVNRERRGESPNVAVVRAWYAAASKRDGVGMAAVMDPQIEFRGAEGLAQGESYVGLKNVMQGMMPATFKHFRDFNIEPAVFHDAGGEVIVEGRYRGHAKVSGEAFDAQFAHCWSLRDGRITHLHQYTNTAEFARVQGPDISRQIELETREFRSPAGSVTSAGPC